MKARTAVQRIVLVVMLACLGAVLLVLVSMPPTATRRAAANDPPVWIDLGKVEIGEPESGSLVTVTVQSGAYEGDVQYVHARNLTLGGPDAEWQTLEDQSQVQLNAGAGDLIEVRLDDRMAVANRVWQQGSASADLDDLVVRDLHGLTTSRTRRHRPSTPESTWTHSGDYWLTNETIEQCLGWNDCSDIEVSSWTVTRNCSLSWWWY